MLRPQDLSLPVLRQGKLWQPPAGLAQVTPGHSCCATSGNRRISTQTAPCWEQGPTPGVLSCHPQSSSCLGNPLGYTSPLIPSPSSCIPTGTAPIPWEAGEPAGRRMRAPFLWKQHSSVLESPKKSLFPSEPPLSLSPFVPRRWPCATPRSLGVVTSSPRAQCHLPACSVFG